MKLSDYIKENLIIPELKAKEKEDALRQMTHEISKEFPQIDSEKLLGIVMDRESLSSTGIGSGIAIPHAKLEQFSEHIVAFAKSSEGVAFDSIDDKPVHLIFLIVGPTQANETHLKALARISKFLHDTSFREQLMMSKTRHEIYEVIIKKDDQY
ncbi:MAG: PTS sugar transporter subunit IIA [Bdellovibrionales bacterium]|nr:PTS sugar transporter subunit IIA [Bdellovibrionales bacterium]